MRTDTGKTNYAFSASLFLFSNFLTGIFVLTISLFLNPNFLTGIEVSQAVAPSLSTSSNIPNDAIDSSILINSTNFASDFNNFVSTVEVETRGLTYDPTEFVDSTKVIPNFRGMRMLVKHKFKPAD